MSKYLLLYTLFSISVICLCHNISTMETTQKIERNEIWLTSCTHLAEVIWPYQVTHHLTAVDKSHEKIAQTLCVFPRSNYNSSAAILSISYECFDSQDSIKWQKIKQHVKSTISHIQMRGYKLIKMNQRTYEKISQLQLNQHYKLINKTNPILLSLESPAQTPPKNI